MGKTVVVAVFLLKLLDISSAAYVPVNTDAYAHHPLALHCPAGCQCNDDQKTAQCVFSVNHFSFETLLQWQLQKLRIVGDEDALEEPHRFSSVNSILMGHTADISENYLNVLSQLNHLEINFFPLSLIKASDFIDFSRLSTLNLAFNNISGIEPSSFEKLTTLEVLNLNGNHIGHLLDNVFLGMSHLSTLYLESNGLTFISELAFHGLGNLKRLYLQNNNIRSLETFIGSLSGLKVLNLEGNKVSYILNSSVQVTKTMEKVYLSSNPFECSCAVKPFLEAVRLENSSINTAHLTCAGPASLRGHNLINLELMALPCYSTAVTAISEPLNVVYQSSVTLSCEANGTSPLGTYWLTPWGDIFASKHVQQTFPDILSSAKIDKDMLGVNGPIKSRVFVTPDSCLHLDNFRGVFIGTFTCVAIGYTGMANSTVDMSMHSKIPEIYMASIFICVYCTASMLTLAIIIGSIRWFVYKCLHCEGCHCCCCRSDDFSIEDKDDKSEPIEVTYESSNGCIYADESDDHDYDTLPPPCPPVNSPQERLSPEKCQTPNEVTDPSKLSPHIWEQLDEVRLRLRDGAERKMEKVRSHVRSITDTGSLKIRNIKDAGTMKIQSIKETGSHAASRVKKNVASGMVQVKYGVQSIKEFCGTGEMGTCTVSMVSVSTDVDSKEQVKIVKSHTFV